MSQYESRAINGRSKDYDSSSTKSSQGGIKKYVKRSSSNSSMEILPPDDGHSEFSNSRPSSACSNSSSRPSSASSRPNSSASRRAPPVNKRGDPSRPMRTPTPTKQIALQAVKRKKEPSTSEDKENLRVDGDVLSGMSKMSLKPTAKVSVPSPHKPSKDKSNHSGDSKNSSNNVDIEDSDEFDTDLEDGEEEDSSSEEEPVIKAPNELMMEFLECVMQNDWKNADKLCKMILIFEPENEEARNFESLIAHKLRIEDDEDSGSEEGSSDDEDYEDEDGDELSTDEEGFILSSSDEDDDEEDDDDDDGDDDDDKDDEGAVGGRGKNKDTAADPDTIATETV